MARLYSLAAWNDRYPMTKGQRETMAKEQGDKVCDAWRDWLTAVRLKRNENVIRYYRRALMVEQSTYSTLLNA